MIIDSAKTVGTPRWNLGACRLRWSKPRVRISSLGLNSCPLKDQTEKKMSAVAETTEGPIEVIQVLFALHPGFGAQELCGPLEILSKALHKIHDPSKPHLATQPSIDSNPM